MSTKTIFENSELALAAYATLTTGKLDAQQAQLRDEGKIMSVSQADAFATKYSVVTQYNDTLAEGGLGTSFSATVFQDTSGNLTLAIRGTLESGDFFPTDADIAIGAGRDQIVAMWNWWQRASTTAGHPVAQVKAFAGTETPPAGSVAVYADSAYNYYLVPAVISGVTANGLLANSGAAMAADADHKLNVTGHSLGGHLAMAFGALFSGAISEVATFNAPGFKSNPGTLQLFSALGGSIPNGQATTNIIADEAGVGIPPWTAIAGLNSRPGSKVDIAIENQWLSDESDAPSARNHSQQILTDSLAVYNLLSKLDASITTASYKSLLAASASGTSASYERILDSLNRILGATQTALPTGNNSRDALYKAIYALQTKLAPNGALKSLVGKLTLTLPTTSLATTAKTDFAEFLSLNALSPVVISTTDAAAIAALKTANPILSNSWPAGYSDNWYADRTTLLQTITKRNQLDLTAATPIVADASYALDRVLDIQYMEAGDTTFKTLTAWNPANNPLGNALSKRDRQLIGFGNDDANTLTGGRKNQVATYSIAACAYSMSARGRFDQAVQPMNHSDWRMAA